jgi:hypothetical protein
VNCPSIKVRRHRLAFILLLLCGLHWALAAKFVKAQETKVNGTPNTSPNTSSQPPGEPPPHPEPRAPQEQPPKKGRRERGSFVAAPLPISSPALGSGIVPVLAYIFPISTTDRISPPSVAGAVGLVTDNGSRAIALGGETYFKQNTYRTTAIYARGSLNYNLYGLGSGDSQTKLPLKQNGQLVFAEFLRRTWWKVFVGPRFLWGSSLITLRANNLEAIPLPPDLGLNANLTAVGFRLTRDTSPNCFYPTAGTFPGFHRGLLFSGLRKQVFVSKLQIQFQQVLGFDAEPGPCIRLVRLLYGRRTSVLWKLHLWHRQQITRLHCRSLSRSLHVWHAAGVSVGLTQEVRPCGVWRLGRSSARRQSTV